MLSNEVDSSERGLKNAYDYPDELHRVHIYEFMCTLQSNHASQCRPDGRRGLTCKTSTAILNAMLNMYFLRSPGYAAVLAPIESTGFLRSLVGDEGGTAPVLLDAASASERRN